MAATQVPPAWSFGFGPPLVLGAWRWELCFATLGRHMTRTSDTATRRRSALRLQESGLIVVILVLAVLLTIFGGTVKVPQFETNAQGERQRVFRVNAAGEREPVVIEKNKFLNAQ